jgi:hypothetical protein
MPYHFNCITLRLICRIGNHGPEANITVIGTRDEESPIQSLPGPVVMASYIEGFVKMARKNNDKRYSEPMIFHCYRNGDFWEDSGRFVPFTES